LTATGSGDSAAPSVDRDKNVIDSNARAEKAGALNFETRIDLNPFLNRGR
jgi:hypothetical protein